MLMKKELRNKKVNICLSDEEFKQFKTLKSISKKSVGSLIRDTINFYYIFYSNSIINKQ